MKYRDISGQKSADYICGQRCGWAGDRLDCIVVDPESCDSHDPECSVCGAVCEADLHGDKGQQQYKVGDKVTPENQGQEERLRKYKIIH